MGNDSRNLPVRLGEALVFMKVGEKASALEVHTASLSLLSGRRPIHLRLEGTNGSVTIEFPRVAFWRFTAELHEQAISVAGASSPRRRPGRKRS
jgi:hypothetical protein